MLRLTVVVLAIALAGTASAAGWRSLRLDGSSEAGFEKSLAEFREELTNGRRYAFILALHDVWEQGTKNAEAEQREYTAADYLRDLDGLGYEQVVRFTDPTGATARRYRADYNPFRTGDARQRIAGLRSPTNDSWSQRSAPIGPHGEQVRGTVDTGPAYQHQLRTMGQQ
jgi:hypothetical protein